MVPRSSLWWVARLWGTAAVVCGGALPSLAQQPPLVERRVVDTHSDGTSLREHAVAGPIDTGRQGRPDGVYTEAQAARGQIVYGEYCAYCHGDDLTGFQGPPLAGPVFMASWTALNLTLDDLFYAASALMPQDLPASLEPQEYIDIVAYILQRNGYPAGDRELTAEPSVLRAIRIEAQRPPDEPPDDDQPDVG